MEVCINGCNVILTDTNSVIEWKKKTENEINRLNYELEEKKELLKDIYKYLYENCNHEIVEDYVDQMKGYKLSVPIKYCEKCELSFNQKLK